ncbi:MAG: HAD family hydrolase, partial [bacterium]
MDVSRRAHWIFDMDGTLTVAVHDFDAIRTELGLPQGKPMLEELALRPAEEARA